MLADPTDTPQQLDLFQGRHPHRPYCTDDLGSGLVVRDAARALQHRYIQLNPPAIVFWLVHDVDRPGAVYAHEDGGVAPPNLAVTNPANGHAHLLYGLAVPVPRTDAARPAPLRYASAVEGAYREALGADAGYSGLICKTPGHAAWRTLQLAPQLYELEELADYWGVDLSSRPEQDRRRRLDHGLGRNVTLFEKLRRWSYRQVLEYKRQGARYGQWHVNVQAQAMAYNDFPTPLPLSEIRATAKSVAKWTWKHFSEAQFSAIQSARGKKGGRPRKYASKAERDRAYYQRKKGR